MNSIVFNFHYLVVDLDISWLQSVDGYLPTACYHHLAHIFSELKGVLGWSCVSNWFSPSLENFYPNFCIIHVKIYLLTFLVRNGNYQSSCPYIS